MNRKQLTTITLLLTIIFLAILPNINLAKADITVNRAIDSTSSDGYLSVYDSTYITAHDSVTGTVVDSATDIYVGQKGSYTIYRGYLFFDTSIIPDSATVTSAKIGLYVFDNQSTADFNVTIQNGQPTYPHSPLQASDFYYSWYSGDGGSRNTSSLTATEYWNVTLSSTGLGWISLTETTKLCLRSNKEIDSTAPTTNEYIRFYTSESGSTKTPILYVTYTVPSGPSGGTGSVTLHGPYLETGAVYNGTINATLFFSGNTTETYTFDGSDGSADTISSVSESMPINCYWNLTSDYTKQRVYFFTPTSSSAEVWLCVADTTTEALNQYYIGITDFAGLTNAYVSTTKNIGGYTRTIERQPLDIMNNMPFWLITYNQYTLKLESDQGTFTWSLPADVVGTKSYIVSKDMVTQVSTARNFTVTATRINGSIINVQYYDPSSATISVTTTVKYYANYAWNTAYTQTDISDSDLDFNWTNAEAARKYTVYITATTTSGSYSWQFALDAPALANLFGFSLDFFGNIGFPMNQVFGLIIAGLFFGLLSWRDTEIGCAVGVTITAILMLVGLLEVPVMAIAIGFMIVIFMYLHRGKETSRTPP